jgi:pyruvate,water dikinase
LRKGQLDTCPKKKEDQDVSPPKKGFISMKKYKTWDSSTLGSSIVAREYGNPAVLATGSATRRTIDGQTVVVDGSKGTVKLK